MNLKLGKRLLSAAVVVGLAMMLEVDFAAAQSGDAPSFGIRPTMANEDIPETFSFFYLQLEPGETISDEAMVINYSDTPIILKFYAADGVTAANSGTAMGREGDYSSGFSHGTREWIQLPVSELNLRGNEERVIPFTISVPPDVLPGHHVAGLVVETAPMEGGEAGQGGDASFEVRVVRRVGVAVVVDVPGPRTAKLELVSAELLRQDEAGAVFGVTIKNAGNVYLKGNGILTVSNKDGAELASIPFEVDTILPGDQALIQVEYSGQLDPGDYSLRVDLDYEEGETFLDGVGVQIDQEEPPTGDQPDTPQPRPREGWSDLKYKVIGYSLLALALVIGVLTILLVRRLRRAGG